MLQSNRLQNGIPFDTHARRITEVFNRFLNEGMPPIKGIDPIGSTIWNYTKLYLRRLNLENAAPKDILRDAEYLLYTSYKDIAFVSLLWRQVAQKDRYDSIIILVPLFEGVRKNFIFVDHTTKATIQKGFQNYYYFVVIFKVGNPK